jgi:polysaccharide pyruvyl transferase WcaK-like protein
MKIINFFNKSDLNNSFVIGYYGGGNFGDELLLETLIILFTKFQFKNVKIIHFSNVNFKNWHKISNFFLTINYKNKFKIFKHILGSKNLIVGGGGLWGLDSNINILVMSFVLFFCKFILRKNVYLLGVGYYSNANLWGRIGAWLAGYSANLIITRDNESYSNFKKLNKNTFIDFDLTFNLKNLNLNIYKNDVELLTEKINLLEKNVFFTIREVEFSKNILRIVKNNPTINFIFLHFFDYKKSNKIINIYNKIQKMCYGLSNLSIYEFDYNPVALFCFFKENADKIFMISSQFHGQIVAYLAGAKFMPVSYSNKNTELFKILNINNFYNVQLITIDDIQNEINNYINK